MTSKLTKRQRFIIASVLVTAISVAFQNYTDLATLITVPTLIIATYILSYFALKEDISGVEYITLFILPITFTLGLNLFITILPDRKIFRLPMYIVLPIGMYIIYLTENIFNVAAIRTIQLLRAAHAVAYIFTLFSAYFLISYVVSLHVGIPLQLLLLSLVVLPLSAQFLWSFDLLPVFSARTTVYSVAIWLVFTQISVMINFFPQSTAMISLFLVAVFYVLLGVLQHFYEKKLTRKPAIEYAIVACIVFMIMIFTTQWQGM